MKVNANLTKRLVDLKLVAADADEPTVKNAALKAIADGALTIDEVAELAREPGAVGKGVLDVLKQMSERLAKLETKEAAPPVAAVVPAQENLPAAPPAPRRTVSQFEKMFAGASDSGIDLDPKSAPVASPDIRVKGAWDRYSTTKSAVVYPSVLGTKSSARPHPLAGRPVIADHETGREMHTLSDRERAISGAWAKWMLTLAMKDQLPVNARMTQHDSELVQYALHECEFGGVLRAGFGENAGDETPNSIAINNRRLTEFEQKALLDDSGSGGLEIAPIVFDDAIIMTPLLNGEVFPLVEVMNITRGRRIEGASMGNVNVSWGGGDGTDVALFNTASFVAAFDTNIFVCDGAIEIGLDFLTDSPVNVLNIVTSQYGQRLLKQLDVVIIQGDGTTQPEGVINQTGINTVSFGAAATVSMYMQLLFAVTKEFKRGYAANRIAFFGNEVSYRRARDIQVGTSDQRLVFGMDVESYSLLNHPYLIDDTLPNTKIGFCNFAWYRMYRRLGLTITSTSEGKTLKRQNELLIVMRSRFGGALTHGDACALTTNAAA